ncbi:hypothetical protein F5B21DRAFT_500413 [Xylaria acuta]|nr:hypothetical protein F5B21DRAFT_500413 [Xylaria acuta]
MLLIDSGGTVMFGDAVAGRENVFEPSFAPVLLIIVGPDALIGNVVNPTEDAVELALRAVELISTVVAGTDVRDTLDNVPTGSGPELKLPLAEKLLVEKPFVTAEVIDALGNVKEVPETELEISLDDRPSEAELLVRLGTVSVATVPVIPLDGNRETEVVSLFVAVLPIELLADEPPDDVNGDIIVGPDNVNDIGPADADAPALFCVDAVPEITELCGLGGPVSVNGTLGLGTDDSGILPVTAPVAAEVTIVSLGNIVSVKTPLDTVIVVIIADAEPVNRGIT